MVQPNRCRMLRIRKINCHALGKRTISTSPPQKHDTGDSNVHFEFNVVTNTNNNMRKRQYFQGGINKLRRHRMPGEAWIPRKKNPSDANCGGQAPLQRGWHGRHGRQKPARARRPEHVSQDDTTHPENYPHRRLSVTPQACLRPAVKPPCRNAVGQNNCGNARWLQNDNHSTSRVLAELFLPQASLRPAVKPPCRAAAKQTDNRIAFWLQDVNFPTPQAMA